MRAGPRRYPHPPNRAFDADRQDANSIMNNPVTRATGLVAHERYFWHDTGSGAGFSNSNRYMQPDRHPEAPDTKRRLLGLLEVSGLADRLVRVAPRAAERSELEYFHTGGYIDAVRELSGANGGALGDSVSIGTGSYEIALLAA